MLRLCCVPRVHWASSSLFSDDKQDEAPQADFAFLATSISESVPTACFMKYWNYRSILFKPTDNREAKIVKTHAQDRDARVQISCVSLRRDRRDAARVLVIIIFIIMIRDAQRSI